MTDSFIRKIQPDPDGLDFDGLRKEGIRLVQEVSGDVWTDYNLHDPGVTVLEALCYGLTDLVYRTGFSAADYLASGDGTIDFRKQALYRPDEIFPCRAVTENDYRKLILGSNPNIENVWIKRYAARAGLYYIYVQLNKRAGAQGDEGARKIIEAVEKVYAANRNLCEDLAGVEIVSRTFYTLRGEIEIDGKRAPANILAEIHFECAQYLSPRVLVRSPQEMHRNGSSLEDLFTGVLPEQGHIAEEELPPWQGHFSIFDLMGKISRIEGVENIKHLAFVDDRGHEADCINLGGEHDCLSVACLHPPSHDGASGIKLSKANKAYQVSLHDVEMEVNRLDYKYQAMRHGKQRFDWLDAMLPSASYRSISDYYSIQNHFPAAYGINSYGVPDTAPPGRKAQAMQLKAYLLFFEQVMANFLQNLQEIPRTFSVDDRLQPSYFYQVLRNDAVPDVEGIYPDGMDSKLAELLADFDNYGDRKSRVLDYLLGIYGEKFTQNSMRHYFAGGTETEEGRLRNKLAFLKEIVDIGKNRAAAFDYLDPAGERSGSGLKKKLKILLDLKSGEQDADGEDFQIVEHILLRPNERPAPGESVLPDDFYHSRLSMVFPAESGRFAHEGFRRLVEEAVSMNCPAHIGAEIFWLEPGRMGRFKALHEKWLAAKRMAGSQSGLSDAAAWMLAVFLLEIREDKNE